MEAKINLSPGRHTLAEERQSDQTEKHSVTAAASFWAEMERIGDGNKSRGVRIVGYYYLENSE